MRLRGGISTTGYKNNSLHRERDYNIIPSGDISMKDVDFPVQGTDNYGNTMRMMPGGEYQFPGQQVLELPLKNKDMKLKRMKDGGAASGHAGMFWDGEKWISSAGGATYSNGMFYANGGPVFPVAGAGAMFERGGSTASFYVDGNGYPVPFAMAPGSGNGGGYLQDLPTHMQMGGIKPKGSRYTGEYGYPPSAGMYIGPEAPRLPYITYPGDTLTNNQLDIARDQDAYTGANPNHEIYMPGAMYRPSEKDVKKLDQMGPHWYSIFHKDVVLPPPQHQYGGQIPGAQLVNPFAMNPGPGTGNGFLQDLPTEMKKGGHAKKKMSPQQIQMMMQAMGQGQPPMMPQGQQMGVPMGQPQGMPQGQPMMKGGGNWIQKATAHMRTDHPCTGSKFGSSSCPPGSKRYNLAKTFKAMHEYGGQFHPLARFMQEGGPGGKSMNLPANDDGTQDTWTPDQSNYDPATDPNNPVNNPGQMPEQGGYAASQEPVWDETGTTDYQTSSRESRQRGRGWGYANAGLGVAGAGMGVASYFSGQKDARNQRNKQFNDRSTVNQYSSTNLPGGKGDWDQVGAFRPDQNVYTRPGYFPSKMGKFGGYHAGQEVELDDREIARLKSMGYKLQEL